MWSWSYEHLDSPFGADEVGPDVGVGAEAADGVLVPDDHVAGVAGCFDRSAVGRVGQPEQKFGAGGRVDVRHDSTHGPVDAFLAEPERTAFLERVTRIDRNAGGCGVRAPEPDLQPRHL